MSVKCMLVEGLPDVPFSRQLFVENFGRAPFGILYDFGLQNSLLVFPKGSAPVIRVGSVIPGMELKEVPNQFTHRQQVSVMSMYRGLESIPPDFMSDVFDVGIKSGFICVLFVPEGEKGVAKSREYVEKRLGSMGRNIGYSISEGGLGKRVSKSAQGIDFSNSDEATLLEELLESLNRSLIRNGTAYKVIFVASGTEQERYLLSKLVCLESHRTESNLDCLFDHIASIKSLHFGQEFAEKLVNFHGGHDTNYIIPGRAAKSTGEIAIGTFMKDSVYDTGESMKISPPSMNLGFVISGLPGSGKTRAAMSVLDAIITAGSGTRIVVISPTDEWNRFALSHGMNLVRICEDRLPINFFRRPDGVNLGRFYESLAMVLASASLAGPYRNPMEKCMLNAFRKVYKSETAPDPAEVYSEIEESIIRMHGKRTNVGVKYTKHGENIKSAMENLVSILQMAEYSAREGLRVEELLGRGIVFDISSAGVETKSYFYALILNQIYSIASSFDSDGDDKLRLVICLEEAQMMLKDPKSPAVEDIKYRMQDFRKKGIGLMLLAHNISDIETGIRRLCQLKLYLKQAADVAETAAKDLVFANVESDAVVSKLKHLNSRVGALSYVSKDRTQNISHDTIFIRTRDYEGPLTSGPNPLLGYVRQRRIAPPKVVKSNITVANGDGAARLRITYFGEPICEHSIKGAKTPISQDLIAGRSYTADLLDERGRTLKRVKAVASREIMIS